MRTKATNSKSVGVTRFRARCGRGYWTIHVFKTTKELRRVARKKFKDHVWTTTLAIVDRHKKRGKWFGVIYFARDALSLPVIVHECVHAAIFATQGDLMNVRVEETMCYKADRLFEAVMKGFVKHNIYRVSPAALRNYGSTRQS